MTTPHEPEILTVTELTRNLKGIVEASFPSVWVQGEISGCTHAGSGHVYFTLKDQSSQLRGVVWRSTAARLRFDLHDGLEVVAQGSLEVYQARGTYQLIVRQMLPQGIGGLELAFRQLQARLDAEGLFDEEHKRPIPRFPRRIALITSPTGAAVRDILQVVSRRWRCVDVVLLPVPVQGEHAAELIALAFGIVPHLPDVDVVITGRGGGSLEDLWAFNEEIVARAIHACPIPVISAVGHEIDVTIADLVADRRALTPSEAAELAVPDCREMLQVCHGFREQLASALKRQAAGARMRLDALASRPVFTRPLERLHDLTERVDDLHAHLHRSIRRRLEQAKHQTERLAETLDALSPLKVLGRGYSITSRADDGSIIRRTADIHVGDQLATLVSQGRIVSRVESIEADTPSALCIDVPTGNSAGDRSSSLSAQDN